MAVVENEDRSWFIAQDSPRLVRRDPRLPGGRIQRSDFYAFELLPVDPTTRRLLEIEAPAGTPEVRVQPRPPVPPGMP